MNTKEIIQGFNSLIKELENKTLTEKENKAREYEFIASDIKELRFLISKFRQGKIKDLADFSRYAKWNYPQYFEMSYSTSRVGISLKDLRIQHSNSLADIISVKNITNW